MLDAETCFNVENISTLKCHMTLMLKSNVEIHMIFEHESISKSFKNKKRCSVVFVSDEESTWEEIMDLREYLLKLSGVLPYDEEMEYRTKDPVRKFQIDYDKSVCLSDKFDAIAEALADLFCSYAFESTEIAIFLLPFESALTAT